MLEAARIPSSERRFALGGPGRATCTLAVFAPVVGLAAAQGGFFPTSWGWASVPLLCAAIAVLIWRARVALSPQEIAFAAMLIALTGWVVLSGVWSHVPSLSVLETQRMVVYVAVVATIAVVGSRPYVPTLLGSLLAAVSVVAFFSLATRLFPDRVGVFDRTAIYRLAQPIGYWNGLAIFIVIGSLLAFAFAARSPSAAVRGISAAVLVLLLPTLYFTFGRAAWIALAVGFLAAIAVDPRRLQLVAAFLVLWPVPAIAVWLAGRQRGLTHAGTTLARAAHDGHRLAAVLLLLAGVNAAAATAFAFAERRMHVGLTARRAFAAAVVLGAIALVSAVFVRYGGPITLSKKGYAAFKAPAPHVAGNLNRRLLSFSGNGRATLWRVAWNDARNHPLLGGGAGTYERWFLAHEPPKVGRVRDAHGLYIETLAELGPFGLALLLVFLAVPFAALGKARRHPLAAGAFAAYVAYLVHAGVDWDWELAAVTVAGLVCGSAILLASRTDGETRGLSTPVRVVAVAALLAAVGLAGIGVLGNTALSRSESAREHGDFVRAASDARHARFWMPWSPAPWAALGRAEVGVGLLADARRSFRKAISLDRGDWQLWYDLATASSGKARLRALQHATFLFPRSNLIAKAQRGT